MQHILYYAIVAKWTVLPERDAKAERLKALGVLNPSPERVRAPWFESGGFFDARDLAQVKYEMLRHARREGATKADAATLFGLSRPIFYQAEAALTKTSYCTLCG